MNFIFSHIPQMSGIDLVVHVVALLGGVLLTYAVFLEAERRQDAVFFLAGACLMVYALWLKNIIFILALGGFMFASLMEFVEIMVGIHKHGRILQEKYKDPKGKK